MQSADIVNESLSTLIYFDKFLVSNCFYLRGSYFILVFYKKMDENFYINNSCAFDKWELLSINES